MKKYDQGKGAVIGQYEKAKEEVTSAYDATKVGLPPFLRSPASLTSTGSLQHTAEETVEKAKETSNSWFGWGESKADEMKKEGAAKVDQAADKVKGEAQKRQ